MGEVTNISWCHHTFNPWRGCQKVHAGCTNCYAETLSKRNPGTLGEWGPSGSRVLASSAMWREPIKWNKAALKAGERRRVFCASLADVFEDWRGPIVHSNGDRVYLDVNDGSLTPERYIDEYPHEFPAASMGDVRARLFAMIESTPWLDWLLLTKRPENVRAMWPEDSRRANAWLGTSISDQETADKWLPDLLKLRDLTPVLFASAEPLIGAVKLGRFLGTHCDVCGEPAMKCPNACAGKCKQNTHAVLDWIIAGGESGHNARPCQVDWLRSIVEQGKAAGVPVFVKQFGAHVEATDAIDPIDQFPNDRIPRFSQGGGPNTARIHLSDKKGGDPEEWPLDLRVREFPVSRLAEVQ